MVLKSITFSPLHATSMPRRGLSKYEEAADAFDTASSNSPPVLIPSLPHEVVATILAHIPKFAIGQHSDTNASDERNGTLFAVSLVSRLWSAAAYEALYGDLRISWRSSTGGRLLVAFQQHPHLRALVRGVSADFVSEEQFREKWYYFGEGLGITTDAYNRWPEEDAGDDEPWRELCRSRYINSHFGAAIVFSMDSNWMEEGRKEGALAFWQWLVDRKSVV